MKTKKELRILSEKTLQSMDIPDRDLKSITKKEMKVFASTPKHMKKDALVDIEQSIQKCVRLGVFK